jgi:hypothetical protein
VKQRTLEGRKRALEVEQIFRHYLRRMTWKQKLYRILKEELTALGYWKQRRRGRPDVENLRGKR